ncbi:hypothetical protein [Terracoccus luteus]|uniref:Uncharacterized protein n=1 Tax=Terracoccus luteus TaxID=53356 RepID=A0A839PRI1_9MICO|nr:hypothetical protein [Terracoccus luteus]MBB2985679.1 hypothetical protein [Terracoccus luteus]MCP2171331.1 hypothetical protein [Terracoccus luteus]
MSQPTPTSPTADAGRPASVAPSRTSWWRRNAVGLALLPVAVAAALAGNGQRLQTLWWEGDLHAVQRPGDDGIVRFVDEYDDGHHRWAIEPAVSLVGVVPATTLPGYDGSPQEVQLSTGARLWRVTLHVEAPSEMILSGCRLALADADGTRWEAGSNALQSSAIEPASPCTPPGQVGPTWLPGAPRPTTDDGAERPPAYDVDSYVVTSGDAAPTEVWLWWNPPEFAALPLSGPGGTGGAGGAVRGGG